MGKLEREVQTSIRRSKINSAIITAAAVTGGVAVTMLAPNILGVLARNKYFRQRKYQLKSSLSRLISAGYIVLKNDKQRRAHHTYPKRGTICRAVWGRKVGS